MKFKIDCPKWFSEYSLSERCQFWESNIREKKKLEEMGFIFSSRIMPNGGDEIIAEPIEVEINRIEELMELGWGNILIVPDENTIDLDHSC